MFVEPFQQSERNGVHFLQRCENNCLQQLSQRV